MSWPQKGRNPQCGQIQVNTVPAVPPELNQVHGQTETAMLASEVVATELESSPLTQADSGSDQPVVNSGPQVKSPYDEFGDDFDQEDEVDDYMLLHPNSPWDIPMEVLGLATMPPFQNGLPGPSHQI
jgi:hypothetical protein